jgi:hypothetical protein
MKRISVNIYLSYCELFKDLIAWGQVDPYESERDLTRIRTLCETRGERTIFIDLPSCAKSFDYALSRGVLDIKKLAILGNRDGLPEFMHSTFAKVFDSNGRLWREDPDPMAVQAIRQVLLLYKKVEIPCSEEATRHEVKAFFSMDRALRPISEPWFSLEFSNARGSLSDASSLDDVPDLFGRETWPASLIRLTQRVCDQIVQRFHHFDPEAIVGNHGPGAVSDAKSGTDKYLFPTWAPALERVFPRDLHGCANTRVFDYEVWYDNMVPNLQRTRPAKLIPVNKTQEKPRLIASEPTANQFIQGGLRKFIRRQIESGVLQSSIAISDQSKSMDLAVRASMDSSISTVDLSNASDRLSCWTVERVFRKASGLLMGLAAARSQHIVDEKYTQTHALLNKYAPQGNATVFPIQSIVYCCLAYAAVIWSTPGTKVRSDANLWASILEVSNRVRVFGDDIILPTHALPALSSLLELCQLKVNGAKSHYSGIFAESCGMDAFKGTDVTPVYLASVEDEVAPGDVQSVIDISNGCYRAGLLNLGNRVMRQIPQIIFDELCMSRQPGPSTLLFTYSSGIQAKRVRYNNALQRDEYRTLVSLPKSDFEKRDTWSSLHQYFIDGPAADFLGVVPKWKAGWARRVRTKLVRRWVPMSG